MIGDAAAFTLPHPRALLLFGNSGEVDRKTRAIKKQISENKIAKSVKMNIVKSNDEKKLVYGIVLEPDTTDLQMDVISEDEIETAAHEFLKSFRVVGDNHNTAAKASVVESYIATADGKNGRQAVHGGILDHGRQSRRRSNVGSAEGRRLHGVFNRRKRGAGRVMSEKKTKKRLKNLSVVEVSLVGSPANGKQFLLTKGERKMELTEKQKGILETPFDTEEKFVALLQKEEVSLTDEAQSALMSSMRMLAAYSEEMPDQLLRMIRDALGMEEEAIDEEEEKAEEVEETKSDADDDIMKSISDLPEEVKAQVQNLFKEKQEAVDRFEEVQKKLDEEKQETIRKEFVVKANTEYKAHPQH